MNKKVLFGLSGLIAASLLILGEVKSQSDLPVWNKPTNQFNFPTDTTLVQKCLKVLNLQKRQIEKKEMVTFDDEWSNNIKALIDLTHAIAWGHQIPEEVRGTNKKICKSVGIELPFN